MSPVLHGTPVMKDKLHSLGTNMQHALLHNRVFSLPTQATSRFSDHIQVLSQHEPGPQPSTSLTGRQSPHKHALSTAWHQSPTDRLWIFHFSQSCLQMNRALQADDPHSQKQFGWHDSQQCSQSKQGRQSISTSTNSSLSTAISLEWADDLHTQVSADMRSKQCFHSNKGTDNPSSQYQSPNHPHKDGKGQTNHLHNIHVKRKQPSNSKPSSQNRKGLTIHPLERADNPSKVAHQTDTTFQQHSHSKWGWQSIFTNNALQHTNCQMHQANTKGTKHLSPGQIQQSSPQSTPYCSRSLLIKHWNHPSRLVCSFSHWQGTQQLQNQHFPSSFIHFATTWKINASYFNTYAARIKIYLIHNLHNMKHSTYTLVRKDRSLYKIKVYIF